jgi:hypothetical protein
LVPVKVWRKLENLVLTFAGFGPGLIVEVVDSAPGLWSRLGLEFSFVASLDLFTSSRPLLDDDPLVFSDTCELLFWVIVDSLLDDVLYLFSCVPILSYDGREFDVLPPRIDEGLSAGASGPIIKRK